ncbi:saccharopine dehydrogenase C-terminal domain-containing protein [Paludibacterium yongneupense]|uniref:saccharopine dehydrogenase C-terminal domain-containing protein n=1 Tax=Paludibacterium yongneupense TaxID=400061 RepID=UPI00041881F0|nr:saccharopine dehydrogenase C-terminal domain-containing protein [Paludibacterium yongneupense]
MNASPRFDGKLVIIGFGSIARASLPLIGHHLGIDRDRITIVTPDAIPGIGPETFGRPILHALDRATYRPILTPLLAPGDFLLNLATGVSSADLIRLAQARGAGYLDTGLDAWDEDWDVPGMTAAERSNYALREQIRPLRGKGGPTAVVTHGANPGLVNHFVKQALLDLAAELLPGTTPPARRRDWALLAQNLGVSTLHIAEQDNQAVAAPVTEEFGNTWSVDGFVAESRQPAELGWGSHERSMPRDGHGHRHGCRASIYLERPGASVRARSWSPASGPYHGFLITHGESVSLADYFTLRDRDGVLYRPTVHYVYRPCDAALASLHDMAGRNWAPPARQRILFDEITTGADTLGVLLAGHGRNAYWYGSRLTIAAARAAAPYNNATTLQVAAGVVSGMLWALAHPGRGLVEPEDMDHGEVLAAAAPYLGEIIGVYTDWTPLSGRGELFREEMITDDPWQFRNVRVD